MENNKSRRLDDNSLDSGSDINNITAESKKLKPADELFISRAELKKANSQLEIAGHKLSAISIAYKQLAEKYNETVTQFESDSNSIIAPASLALRNTITKLPVPQEIKKAADRLVQKNLSSNKYKKLYVPDLKRNDVLVSQPVNPATKHSDVFIFSIINWNFRTQRPQHIAKELSSNHRVFFVEMETSATGLEINEISKNLYCIRLPAKNSGFGHPYTSDLSPLERKGWVKNIHELCDLVKATSTKQVIIQHPWWWQILKSLPPDFVLNFDCMDDISGFNNTEDFILELEHDMLVKSNRVVVSSQTLYDKYSSLRSDLHLVRNGCEETHFDSRNNNVVPQFLAVTGFKKESGQIDVGYVGAIAEWFDAELIRDIAAKNPDMKFHLCGGVSAPEKKKIEQLDNIVFYGEIPYDQVPNFITQMDVMTIPFQLLPIIQACDPVKMYEYSAMGKPTVATEMPELQRAKEIVYMANDAESFATQIRTAFVENKADTNRSKLIQFALDNTWKKRADSFRSHISEFPLVTVVVLAYGDTSWTTGTVHSIYDNGSNYPNLEVLIVDNGSDEESLVTLRGIAQQHKNARLIENGANLGFAKGNNVGIDAASGDYILLLNNDTYLAPGAIHSMVSHLQNNPEIGLVGPLTNNIGNEAKLFVEYPDICTMQSKCCDWLDGYRGDFTSLNTLAYFAVMMRKSDISIFGKLSEDYGQGMFEDDDHCQEIRKNGFICALAEDAFVHHHLSATFSTIGEEKKKTLFERNKAIYEKKWGAWIPHTYRTERPDPIW